MSMAFLYYMHCSPFNRKERLCQSHLLSQEIVQNWLTCDCSEAEKETVWLF